MLNTLLIKNLALIENLEIELNPGLNIITGETGAGKSIMIGAVQLLFGKRADRSLIRTGEDTCEVSAIIDLQAGGLLEMVNCILEECGAPPCDDHQLLITRRIREQTGRNFVNGSPVPLQILRQLRELLVDIHGPYDNQSLLKTARQLEVLDDFAGVAKELKAYRELYVCWKELQEKLAAVDEDSPSPELIDYLKYQVREVEQANPQPGEDEELTARHEVAAHSHQILQIVSQSRQLLSESDENLIDELGQVMRLIMDLERIDQEAGARFAAGLESAVAELRDLDGELYDYASSVEIDPAEFEEMEERIAELRRLKRKFGGTIESVLQHADECRERLKKLENFDAYRAELGAQVANAEAELRTQAAKLSKKRQKAATSLGPEITKKLKFLGFPDCRFSIELQHGDLTPSGFDIIEFYFAPNPGEGNRPLRDIASSGEIARVMLALKTVLAQADKVPVLIFDEVDANIGGVVANRVGEELRRLGTAHQVFCITHQPQVAAGAHQHFVVRKLTRNKRTSANIAKLDSKERVNEIARMLGGEDSASVVNRHAQELIARASAD